MHESAFKTLGIEPTSDGRAIRTAFLRLARIYHPDRFAGMAPDVRAEAERRMKEATAAYESLRATRASARAAPGPMPQHRTEAWERAKRARAAAAERRLEAERSRARWRLWEELERQAKERAAWEASVVASTEDEPHRAAAPVDEPVAAEPAAVYRSAFSRRLSEAREGQRGLPARRSASL